MNIWPVPLRYAAAAYGVVGTAVTLLVNLVFLDVPTLEGAYLRAGVDPAKAHAAATAGHLGGLASNAVLCALYLAVGIAALRGHRWAFWVGLVIYGLTATGVVVVPLRDTGLSAAGMFWTLLNDGLAAILFGWMLVLAVRRLTRRWW